MSIPLIIVADQSKARFFSVDTPEGELNEIQRLEHDVAREKAGVLASDRPGRSFDHLVIVAGARFLGLLRESISNQQQLRVTEINKNLGQYDAREIRTHLPARL